VRNDDDEE